MRTKSKCNSNLLLTSRRVTENPMLLRKELLRGREGLQPQVAEARALGARAEARACPRRTSSPRTSRRRELLPTRSDPDSFQPAN